MLQARLFSYGDAQRYRLGVNHHQIAATDFVLWNAVAYHPHVAGQPLSNRAPNTTERRALRPLLEQFLALYPGLPRLAIGRICQAEPC